MTTPTKKDLMVEVARLSNQLESRKDNTNEASKQAYIDGRQYAEKRAISLVSDMIGECRRVIDVCVVEDSKLGYDEAVKVLATLRKVKIKLMEGL